MGLRIVVAADSAGVEYKDVLKKDLQDDPRVDEVIDVGVSAGEDIDYPACGSKRSPPNCSRQSRPWAIRLWHRHGGGHVGKQSAGDSCLCGT